MHEKPMAYMSARTMLEKLLTMGLSKSRISSRTGLNIVTVNRVLTRPHTYVPNFSTEMRIRKLYDERTAELEADAIFRKENGL